MHHFSSFPPIFIYFPIRHSQQFGWEIWSCQWVKEDGGMWIVMANGSTLGFPWKGFSWIVVSCILSTDVALSTKLDILGLVLWIAIVNFFFIVCSLMVKWWRMPIKMEIVPRKIMRTKIVCSNKVEYIFMFCYIDEGIIANQTVWWRSIDSWRRWTNLDTWEQY